MFCVKRLHETKNKCDEILNWKDFKIKIRAGLFFILNCTSGHAEICTGISTFLLQVIPAGVQSIWFEHENKLITAALCVWFFNYHRQTAYYYPAVAGSSVFSLSTIWAVFRFPVLVYLKTGVFIFITVYENEWEMDRWMDGSWLSLTAHTNFSKFWLEVSWDQKLSQWSQPGRLLCSCQLKQCVIKENSPDFWTTALHRRDCWLIEFWCMRQVYSRFIPEDLISKTACCKNDGTWIFLKAFKNLLKTK